MEKRWKNHVLAHRGWSQKFPENTQLAFEQALQIHANGIELDVQLSADAVPVIMHDRTVDRTTNGHGAVSSLPLRELQSLNAAVNFADSHGESIFQPIPTLASVLSLVSGAPDDILINIELKIFDSDEFETVKRVLKDVAESGLAPSQVLYSSFNHYCLQYLKKIRDDAQIGLLLSDPIVDPWYYARYLGAVSVNLKYRHAKNDVIEACHREGISVCAWTVDDETEMSRLFENGVDIVISNTPDAALKVRAQM